MRQIKVNQMRQVKVCLLALSFVLSLNAWAPAEEHERDEPRAPICSVLPDFPGATATTPGDISNDGTIVGIFTDAAGHTHGYSLVGDTFSQFDFPGATATFIYGLNGFGDMVGRYFSPDGARHGFLLSQGTFTSIDIPGATEPAAIGVDNDNGIAGYFCTTTTLSDCRYNSMTDGNTHGFLLADNVFQSIDVPLATYTEAWRRNKHGQILGRYRDTDGKPHNFLMGPDGDVTTIDFPLAVETAGRNYSDTGGMNSRGDIVSTHCSAAPCPATAPEWINFPGAVHGFLRTADGTFFSLDAPGAVGSGAFGINDHGVIVGGFRDAANHTHGFSCKLRRHRNNEEDEDED